MRSVRAYGSVEKREAALKKMMSTVLKDKEKIEETIAQDKDSYVAIAIRLGRDPAWRRQQAQRVLQQCHRLYNDTAPVEALEKFLRDSVQA